jgi:hypothetical protein
MSEADAQAVFTSLAKNISATVSSSQYNGISLMDADGWGGDERLDVTGGTATISIQMGSASTFFLRDLSSLKNLENIVLADEKTNDNLGIPYRHPLHRRGHGEHHSLGV